MYQPDVSEPAGTTSVHKSHQTNQMDKTTDKLLQCRDPLRIKVKCHQMQDIKKVN